MSHDDFVEKPGVGAANENSGPHPALSTVREHFPDHEKLLTRLFDEDDEFRGLCDDYRDCLAYLARTRAPSATSESLRKEFSALQLRLETELLQCIENADAASPGDATLDDENRDQPDSA
jgi:hypothetical protein